MIKDKRTFFILLACLFSVFTYFHALVKDVVGDTHGGDFTHYWLMSSLLKEGHDIWDWNKQTCERSIEISKEQKITLDAKAVHSLGFFLFILPFTFLPLRPTAFLWLALGHLCLFYSLWLILNICKAKPSLEDLLMVLFLVFAFWPLREQLHSEQPSFFILFFLAASLFLMKKKQILWAGIFLGLAIQFREYLVVVVLFFLWRRNWRFLSGLILSLFILKGLAILVFGWPKEFSYWKHMFLMFGGQPHFGILNLSLSAVIYRIGKDSLGMPICFLLYLLCAAFFTGKAFFWTTKKEVDLELGFSLFLVLAFLVSPWIHEQHYVALFPAFIITWLKLQEEKDSILYGLFISAYLFLGLSYSVIRFPSFHSGLLAIFTGGKLLGVIILFFLITKLIQRENTRIKYET